MKNFIGMPFVCFQKERKINKEIKEALFKSNTTSNLEAYLIYFFMLFNLILLLMNLMVYFFIIHILLVTLFVQSIYTLFLVMPLLFLVFLRLFQTKWVPKVRKVQLNAIGFDVDPIVEKYE